MPDFAELIYGTADNTTKNLGNGLPQAVQAGAELALKAEQLQQSKRALVQKQQEIEQAKYEKLGGYIKDLASMPDGPGRKMMGEKFIPAAIESMGMQDKFHPLVLENMIKDNKLLIGAQAWVANGGDPSVFADPAKYMEHAKEFGQLGSMQQVMAVAQDNPAALAKEREQFLQRKNARDNAIIVAEAAQRGREYDTSVAGRKETDKAVAKDVADYSLGSDSNLNKNIKLLSDAAEKMEKGEVKTKSPFAKVLGIFSSSAASTYYEASNPKAAAVRDDVRTAIQAGLKEVLGGQYTEREGVDMFNRAYNESFDDKENARRTRNTLAAIVEMKNNKDAAVAYFREKGTLAGFSLTNSPPPPAPPPGTIDFHGRAMNKEGLERFIKDHTDKSGKAQHGLVPEARKLLQQLSNKKKN